MSRAEVRAKRDVFASLVGGYKARNAGDRSAVVACAARIRTLLEEFRNVRDRSELSERVIAEAELGRLRALLRAYREATARYQLQQEELADEFNLLAALEITHSELRHSMALAWLLDHNMRGLGTHAQRNLGFRLFLEHFRLPESFAECPYRVRREVRGDDSIVDIEVACQGRFLVRIENKLWSSEGVDQTNREWRDIVRRAASLGLDPENPTCVRALFLTPYRTRATNPHFENILWRSVAKVFEKFADQAKPPEVKLFASHYAKTLHRFIVSNRITEDQNAERMAE